MHLVDLHGEAVADPLHRQVLPHRLHLLPQVDVLLLPALVAKRRVAFRARIAAICERSTGSGRTVFGSGADVSRRYFLSSVWQVPTTV